MKESYYNVYAETKKAVVCYNTIHQKFVLLPKGLYHTIKNGLFLDIDDSSFQLLKENHILIDDNENEREELIKNHNEAISEENATYELTLLPSLDCNLRCWYCFETRVADSRLTPQTTEAIFNHVKQVFQKKHINQIHIELFGGEPLLYFEEELYPLLNRIKQYVESVGKSAHFVFVTNGVCITSKTLPLFANLKARFQISIDGYRKKHNNIKKMPDSEEDVYGRVMKTIHSLVDTYEAYINLRINYDRQTLNYVEEVIKDVIDINPRYLNIHLERVWQTIGNDNANEYDMNRILGFIMSNGFSVSYLNLFRKHYSCKAGILNQAVISYNGDVYKCSGRDFTKAHKEGRLLSDGTICWDVDKLGERLRIRTYDNDLCMSCKWLPMCWGPCCQKLLENRDEVRRHCPFSFSEISMDDYVLYRFNNERVRNENT